MIKRVLAVCFSLCAMCDMQQICAPHADRISEIVRDVTLFVHWRLVRTPEFQITAAVRGASQSGKCDAMDIYATEMVNGAPYTVPDRKITALLRKIVSAEVAALLPQRLTPPAFGAARLPDIPAVTSAERPSNHTALRLAARFGHYVPT